MLGKIFAVMCLVSVALAAAFGEIGAIANAVLAGAEKAVTLSISLLGTLCFFGGIMRILQEAGWIRLLARLLRPLLKPIFPTAWKSGKGAEEITACLCANLLGIGNAATPLALSAMERMQEENPTPDTATDDMVTFTVLNTAPPGLFPTTVLSLRYAAGSADPFAVLVPIWVCSALTSVVAVFTARAGTILSRRRRTG